MPPSLRRHVDTLRCDDDTPVAHHEEQRARTPKETLLRALAAVALARRLRRCGWYMHQHLTPVLRCEKESTPVEQPLPPEAAPIVERLQRIVDGCCNNPAPNLNLPFTPWPHDSTGVRLQWASTVRPAERSFTCTDAIPPDHAVVIWKSLVAELANDWADSSRHGLSAGRVFVGPRDRLIFWPAELNALLARVTARYGNILDMFAIAAACGLKIDLKAAYRAIGISEEDALYHAAVVDSIWVVFRRLSFGMAQSPTIFVLLLDVTLDRYRASMPHTVAALSQFVDDSGLASVGVVPALLCAERLLLAFRADGWWLSAAKIFLLPAARLAYTGFIADFTRRLVVLRADKIAKAAAVLRSVRRPTDEAIAAASPAPDPDPTSPDAAPSLVSLFDPSFALPSALRTDPLPEPATLPRPDAEGGVLALSGPEAYAISVVVGYLCWFHVVVPFLSPWRAALDRLGREGRWTPEGAQAFDDIFAILHLTNHSWHRPVDPQGEPLVIVCDASGTGWGAILRDSSGKVIYLCGTLPPGSSTFREAFAARAAAVAAIRRGLVFGHIRVTTDSTTLVGSAGGRSRVPGVRALLATFAAWAAQGLHAFFEWSSRSAAPLRVADGLSSAARPLPWPLRPVVLSWLWDLSMGWDLDLTASEESATVPAYATPDSDAIPSERLDELRQLRPESDLGWQGTWLSLGAQPDRVAFVLPLWSELKLLHSMLDRGTLPSIILVAPTEPADWWAPHLVALSAAASSRHPLGTQATTPPNPGTSRDPRPLSAYLIGPRPPRSRPRPPWWTPWRLSEDGDVELHPGPPRSAPPDLASSNHAHDLLFGPPPPSAASTSAAGRPTARAPALGTAPSAGRTSVTLPPPAPAPAPVRPPPPPPSRPLPPSTQPPADRPPVRPAPGPCRPPAAPAPRGRQRQPPASADAHSFLFGPPGASAAPRLAGTGSRHTSRPPTPTSTSIPPPPRSTRADPAAAAPRTASCTSLRPPDAATGGSDLTASRAAAAVGCVSRAPPPATAGLSPAAAAPAPQHAPTDQRPAPTMGDWCDAMLRTAALVPAPTQVPDGVAAAHASAISRAGVTTARRANAGSSAPARLPRMLRQFAELRGVVDHPWSLPQLEAFMLDYCQSRILPDPPCGWNRLKFAGDALDEASRVAAASRRVVDGPWRFPAPPYCGAAIKIWAQSKGARDVPEHSAAFPVHATSILAAMPTDPAAKHYRAARAWFLMSMFCLRTGILFHLYSDMFIPYDGGFLLVWRFVQKRAAGDADDIDARSRIGTVTAARHPLLADIIRHEDGNHRLFDGLTHAELSAFVRECLPNAPPGFDVRTYGARTGADHDAQLLAMPDDLTRVLMWWKRAKPDMRGYYGGVNIRLMFIFSERRLRVRATHVLPGVRDGVITDRGLTDWDTPVASTLPPAPAYQHILNALRVSCPSLAVSRRVRAASRAERARVAAGLGPSPALPDGTADVLEGYCSMCFDEITAEDAAAACICCDELACTGCHPNLREDFRCLAHRRAAPAPKRPRASGAGAPQP